MPNKPKPVYAGGRKGEVAGMRKGVNGGVAVKGAGKVPAKPRAAAISPVARRPRKMK